MSRVLSVAHGTTLLSTMMVIHTASAVVLIQ